MWNVCTASPKSITTASSAALAAGSAPRPGASTMKSSSTGSPPPRGPSHPRAPAGRAPENVPPGAGPGQQGLGHERGGQPGEGGVDGVAPRAQDGDPGL